MTNAKEILQKIIQLLVATIYFVFVCNFLFVQNAKSEDIMKVIAVVNDAAITSFDLSQRINLAIVIAGLPNTNEIKQQILPRVLTSLIEERLKLQAAQRNSITVNSIEIDRRIEIIERQNNLQRGELISNLQNGGIQESIFLSHIRGLIAWDKFIGSVIVPQILITPEEINEEIKLIKANEGKPEFDLSEIFISLNTIENTGQAENTVNHIYNELQNKQNFERLAREFSQGAMATQGGHLGWVRSNMLEHKILEAIISLENGAISEPILGQSGYHIIRVNNKRTTRLPDSNKPKIKIAQALFSMNENLLPDEQDNQIQLATTISEVVSGCVDFIQTIEELGTGYGGMLEEIRFKDLSEKYQNILAELPVGKPSVPIKTDEGVIVLMLCSPYSKQSKSAEEIENKVKILLQNRTINFEASRFIRQLRRNALIDIRL